VNIYNVTLRELIPGIETGNLATLATIFRESAEDYDEDGNQHLRLSYAAALCERAVKERHYPRCVFCHRQPPDDVDALIDEGWIPSYWDGDTEQDGPICPDCQETKHITMDFEKGKCVITDPS
jgi:hypothetical protein